jgi:SAM-dependent methyltransferase
MNNSPIKDFYDQNCFPGLYTIQDLKYHIPVIKNSYLNIINTSVANKTNILDVGCGSGLISNLFGTLYPECKFTSVDFADSIDYAKSFANIHGIKNIEYIKKDFLKFDTTKQFDCIICQGVLHHIPNWQLAIDKIKELLRPGGVLVLGIYHPLGKILKNLIKLDYATQVLYQDQECNPFELSFSKKAAKQMFLTFSLINQWPSNIIGHAMLQPLRFSRSGGLVVYVFQKNVL